MKVVIIPNNLAFGPLLNWVTLLSSQYLNICGFFSCISICL